MPKRILNLSVTLTRGGKRVTIRPNILVDLTPEEIKEIQAAAGKDAVRTPRNEETEMVTQVLPASGITNLADTAANPDASVPAPMGSATSPTTGSTKSPTPAKAGSKADTKVTPPADEEL